MNTSCRCKFFYLKETTFSLKGEWPIYACEKGHDINTECNKSCPDSEINISSSKQLIFEDFIINKMHGAYLRMLANGHRIIAIVVYGITRTMVSICILLHLISKRIDHKSS